MQSLIAVIFKEDMDRAEAYRVERGAGKNSPGWWIAPKW